MVQQKLYTNESVLICGRYVHVGKVQTLCGRKRYAAQDSECFSAVGHSGGSIMM